MEMVIPMCKEKNFRRVKKLASWRIPLEEREISIYGDLMRLIKAAVSESRSRAKAG